MTEWNSLYNNQSNADISQRYNGSENHINVIQVSPFKVQDLLHYSEPHYISFNRNVDDLLDLRKLAEDLKTCTWEKLQWSLHQQLALHWLVWPEKKTDWKFLDFTWIIRWPFLNHKKCGIWQACIWPILIDQIESNI